MGIGQELHEKRAVNPRTKIKSPVEVNIFILYSMMEKYLSIATFSRLICDAIKQTCDGNREKTSTLQGLHKIQIASYARYGAWYKILRLIVTSFLIIVSVVLLLPFFHHRRFVETPFSITVFSRNSLVAICARVSAGR